MLNINKEINDTTLTIRLDGRLDTLTASELEEVLDRSLSGTTELIFDFEKLVYLSSAGIRVLIYAHQIMEEQSGMTIKNVSAEVREVFEVTGLLGSFHFA